MITPNYTNWEDLTNYIKEKTGQNFTGSVCHEDHKGLSRDGKLPYSISVYEFNYMKNFIIKNNLNNGYELATGTAISTIAIGWALKQNEGKLLSLDSYMECEVQAVPIGAKNGQFTETDITKDIIKQNQQLVDLFELRNVFLKKGWSPEDTKKYIKEIFGEEKIDFVFLDCPKSLSDFVRDAGFLREVLADKYAIFVHDTFCYPLDEFNRLAKQIFSIDGKQISQFHFENDIYGYQYFPLSVITNIE